MVDSNGSWLSKNKKLVAIVAFILVIAIIVIIIGYQLGWTGFNTSSITVQTNATKGTTLPTNITVTLPSKTLYDWLQLLIVPFVIAVAGYVINLTISRGEQAATAQRDKTERDIASDRQNEVALKEYIDKMSELLLHENLRESTEEDEVRNVARFLTAITVVRLDARRKEYLFGFLKDSKLIGTESIIKLSGLNFSRIYLKNRNLTGLNFSGVFMIEANLINTNLTNSNFSSATLTDADLTGANLSHTNLTDADLTGAKVTPEQLAKAKSLKYAIMPDGSIHD
jgi:hypothetical protein